MLTPFYKFPVFIVNLWVILMDPIVTFDEGERRLSLPLLAGSGLMLCAFELFLSGRLAITIASTSCERGALITKSAWQQNELHSMVKFSSRLLCLDSKRIQLNSYLSQQSTEILLDDSMANFDDGLCFECQRIQLKSLYITTENFTGLDGEFWSIAKFCLSFFASNPSELLILNFSNQSCLERSVTSA